jgi:hypothetical protein
VNGSFHIKPAKFRTSVGEHLIADVDTDDLACRREVLEIPPGPAGDIKDSPTRIPEVILTIPTSDQLVKLAPPSEFVSHVCVRVGDLVG